MNPTAIYSKSGKGVQEASGKTSLLQRADRAVLAAIDGRANLGEVAQKCGKTFDPAFQKLIQQLDKDGFIREVSAGAGAAAPAKPAAAPFKPAAGAPKMAPKPAGPSSDFGDLDFSSLGGASKPASPPSRPAAPPPPPPKPAAAPPPPPASSPRPAAAPPPPPSPQARAQTDALSKAREEAEARAQAERDRIRQEAEAKTRAEMESKLRAEAEKKMKEEAAAKAAAEAEAKVKAARDAALKAAEAKVKAEAEAKAKLEAERKAREEMEKRLEEERKAREEAERKAKEEAERVRREAEEKARREREEMERRLEEERKAREEAERKAKEEAERVRRELEEERKRLEAERKREEEERAARKKREEEEAEARRKQREEEERKAEEEREAKRRQREEEDRRADEERAAKRKQREAEEEAAREAEREARRKREEEQAAALLAAAEARKAEPKPPPKAPQSFGDSLLADLDSFTNKDEEERKAREEEERKAKAEAERQRREQAERQAREDAERQRREDEERSRKEEEARRAREEDERRQQEDERRRREQEEIRRKATAATAAAMAAEGKSGPKSTEEDIPISDDDLHMDEVKKEQAALAKTQAREKEKEKEREKAAAKAERRAEADSARIRKPVKWGKLVTTLLVLLIVGGLIVVHVMPVPVADYERSATEALGRPVKIGDARFSLVAGPEIRFSDVRIGDARISQVNAGVSPGSLFSDRKEFTRVEIDTLTLPQEALAESLFATVKADNLVIDRIVIKKLVLPGPAVMPKDLQADAQLDPKGALRSATVRGPDGLVAKIVPKDGTVEFDVLAAGFTLPIAPEITLSKFGMKGSASPRGMKVDEWGGAIFNGGISGTANIRWGNTWTVDGVVTVRGINAAVFAPALLSNGTGEGTARFTMAGADPAKLASTGRLEGNFTVTQGTLGSYDLAKGIQSSGKQASGSTSFVEMTGQAVYDKGAVSLRNVNIGAGALNAAVSADIAQGGALSGRIVADVKTANRSQQATIVLGGTVKEPQVRN